MRLWKNRGSEAVGFIGLRLVGGEEEGLAGLAWAGFGQPVSLAVRDVDEPDTKWVVMLPWGVSITDSLGEMRSPHKWGDVAW